MKVMQWKTWSGHHDVEELAERSLSGDHGVEIMDLIL